MNYGSHLPVTGGAGMVLLGHFLGVDDIMTAAIALVLFGIAAYRYGSRIGRGRTTALFAAAGTALAIATAGHIGHLPWVLALGIGLTAAVLGLYLASRISPRQPRTALA